MSSIAPSYTTQTAPACQIKAMRTAEETRLIRLQQLIAEAGSQAALNLKAGRSKRDATINQIVNRLPGKTGKPKELGPTLARELEAAFNKPRGWMDNDPEAWPFPRIPIERILALDHDDLLHIQGALSLALAEVEAQKTTNSKNNGPGHRTGS